MNGYRTWESLLRRPHRYRGGKDHYALWLGDEDEFEKELWSICQFPLAVGHVFRQRHGWTFTAFCPDRRGEFNSLEIFHSRARAAEKLVEVSKQIGKLALLHERLLHPLEQLAECAE